MVVFDELSGVLTGGLRRETKRLYILHVSFGMAGHLAQKISVTLLKGTAFDCRASQGERVLGICVIQTTEISWLSKCKVQT